MRTILRDSVLAIARVRISGGIEFRHKNQRNLGSGPSGREEISEWETTRTVWDSLEWKEAHRIRTRLSRDRDKIGVAYAGAGIAIPIEKTTVIEAWAEQAKQDAARFNARARFSKITVSLAVFEMQSDNLRAAAVLAEEIRSVLDALREAVESADVPKFRELVKRIEGFKEVLTPDVGDVLYDIAKDLRQQAAIMAATLKVTSDNVEAARSAVDMSLIDAARFVVDEAMPEDAFQPAPVIDAGVLEMGAEDGDYEDEEEDSGAGEGVVEVANP